MQILIIDISRRGTQIYRRYLAEGFPGATITEHHPEKDGIPGPDFDWSAVQLLLLGHELGETGTATEWLQEFSALPGFPPARWACPAASWSARGRITSAGAAEVLVKRDLTPELMLGSARAALAAAAGDDSTDSGQASSDAEVVREVRERDGLAGDYSFKRLIGQGAMSRVYLAERLHDQQTVVLKILDGSLADDNEAVQRFILEAKLVAEIDSPHVVRIFEQGFTNAYGYMAMEFFSRGDLKQQIEKGMQYKQAMRYLLQIARGLEAVHDAGIVHRDLKPANLMFRASGELVIADFGIARRTDTEAHLTAMGAIMGTPFYMSPEQVRGEPATHRSDLYSAGVIFYEMLTGTKPFNADSLTGIVMSHLNSTPPPLPQPLAPLQPMVDRLIAREPLDRYPAAAAVLEDLQRFARR